MWSPRLVELLARQAVEVIAPDPAVPITLAHIDTAPDLLIQRQGTHLDSGGGPVIANPIYREIIPRVLAGTVRCRHAGGG